VRFAWVLAVAGCGRLHFDHALDAGDPDASDAPGAGNDWCEGPRTDTVALYTFDSGAFGVDAMGAHTGTLRGTATSVASPCGQGMMVGDSSYVLVPDSPAFDLDTGSIEMLMRLPVLPLSTQQAPLARDASGAADGHLLFMISSGGHALVRLQRAGGISVSRCTDIVPVDTWFHLGVSFGGGDGRGLRIWLDHVESTVSNVSDPMLGELDCAAPHPFGLAGNDNALVIGAANSQGAESDPDPSVTIPFTAGMLDQVRLSSGWRDFGAP
jgi:hypothetical protein